MSFSRLYPVPDVEEFTIGRRADATAVVDAEPDVPWDEASLRLLAAQGNAATLALLDLSAAEETSSVGVKDVAEQAGITEAGVRGQLAGLTMRLKNPRYGFAQSSWPVTNTWLPGGFASYRMDPALAAPGARSGRTQHLHRLARSCPSGHDLRPRITRQSRHDRMLVYRDRRKVKIRHRVTYPRMYEYHPDARRGSSYRLSAHFAAKTAKAP